MLSGVVICVLTLKSVSKSSADKSHAPAVELELSELVDLPAVELDEFELSELVDCAAVLLELDELEV